MGSADHLGLPGGPVIGIHDLGQQGSHPTSFFQPAAGLGLKCPLEPLRQHAPSEVGGGERLGDRRHRSPTVPAVH